MVINPPHKIKVADSDIHGLGVFATQKILKGEIFEVAPVLKLDSNMMSHYRFFYPRGGQNQYFVIGLGYSSYYNHSENPSAEWDNTDGQESFNFYALRDIEVGEEITVYYGDSNYWASTGQSIDVK